MKRFTTSLIFGYLLLSGANAQPILTYSNHALKADVDNPMSYCDYKEPGPAGANKNWDFSDLQFNLAFTGYLKNSMVTEIGGTFPGTNTELIEFDSRFYFFVDEDKIEQYGYSSVDGGTQTRYDIPFVKMKFPFTYGNSFSGNFSGRTFYSGIEGGDILGNYSVEADAFGALILPGNTTYENTLRIRTEKNYINSFKNRSEEVNITTYRWYTESHRYPILVLTEYTVKSDENISINHQAAYNNNAVHFIFPLDTENVLLYPNPTTSCLTLEFNAIAAGTIKLTISDASGKVVRTFAEDITTGGINRYDLTDEVAELSPAMYYLTIQSGEVTINRSFTLVE